MSEFYNSIAQKYDAIFPLSPAHKAFFAKELHGKRLLDVGAGTGNLAGYLRTEGYEVTAIDLNEALIAQATAKGIAVQQLNMLNINALPPFDTIICIGNTLPHLSSEEEVITFLQKAYNELTPNGKLIVQIVNFEKYFAQKEGNFLGNLPLIQNEKVKFERWYELNSDGKIVFNTLLDDTIANKELLLPILPEKLTDYLSEIGFKEVKSYGNFKKEPFTPQTSQAFVITAIKH